MKLGCSYFGNRILKHYLRDLEELCGMGCDFVVHTYSENDMIFCHAAVADLVAATRDAGLEAWIDPWGVGKVFGGEAFSNFVMQNVDAMQVLSDGRPTGAACPNNPKFRAFMRQWIEAAASSGAQVAFWDEPHFYIPSWMGGRPNTWGCRCSHCQKLFEERIGKPMPNEETPEVCGFKEMCVEKFLRDLTSDAAQHGLRNALCVLPHRNTSHGTTNWENLAQIRPLDVFGTDPYWLAAKHDLDYVRQASREVVSIARRHGLEAQIWLQGFGVPSGKEDELVQAVEIMCEEGVRNIAVWGIYACEHLSWIRPANPRLAWEKIKAAFRRAKELADD
ncbi:MAG: hypothetical protein ACPL7D_03420 [Candidatus Sumerlaeaceae bacterium]|jgi:hypothetical protein